MTVLTILTIKDINAMIDAGKLVIIFRDKVYDITRWKKYHPGGELALVHMNGKDATDAMIALHPESVFKKIKAFYIGDFKAQVDLQYQKNAKVSEAYRKLNGKLEELGMYKSNKWFWIRENLKFAVLYFTAIYLVAGQCGDYGYFLSSLLFGFLWHQVAFVAHDSIYLILH